MAVTFRRATNRDLAIVHDIVGGALREYGLDLTLDCSDKDLTDIEHHYDARGGVFEIMEDPAGTPLGVLGWRPGEDGICELKKLYLTRDARGRGLGRLGVERVVAWARAARYRAIVLETAAVLAEANRLYTRFGFVQVRGPAAESFATLSKQCDVAYRLDLATTR